MSKIFITIAVWGSDYTETFVHYSLATQLSTNNIPRLAEQHDVTYQMITTAADKAWLERQPLMIELKLYSQIEWELFDESRSLPVGVGGGKYSFLSVAQNLAMNRAREFDFLIFNYADFIWSDGSLPNLIHKFDKNTDAVLSFCLPVDHQLGVKAIESFAGQIGGKIDLSPLAATNIALNALHREAERRFWSDKSFTVTPTYIIWDVADEGVMITAYHQTILALRVDPNNAFYHNGIFMGSLDGFYSAVLAANARIAYADDSDKIFAFSLYETIINSAITDKSTREDALRQCLKQSITVEQRCMALHPIQVKRKQKLTLSRWNEVKNIAIETLEKIHNNTKFDPNWYYATYCSHQQNFLDADLSNTMPMTSTNVMKKIRKAGADFLKHQLFSILAPSDLLLNGDFSNSTANEFQYIEGAWVPLPFAHWIGHFDHLSPGKFYYSKEKPSSCKGSLVIQGAPNGSSAYFGQKISRERLVAIREKGFFYCRGYVRAENSVDSLISPHLIIPIKPNDFSSYQCKNMENIRIQETNTWQYFEFKVENIRQYDFSNGAIFYFLINGLDSYENKIYFADLQVTTERTRSILFKLFPLIEPLKLHALSRLLTSQEHRRSRQHHQLSHEFSMLSLSELNSVAVYKKAANFLLKNTVDDLAKLIKEYFTTLEIGPLSVTADVLAYYWIGMLPEHLLGYYVDTNALFSLLKNAEEALRKATLLVPLFVDAQKALAINLWMQGKFLASLAQFQQVEYRRKKFAQFAKLDPNYMVLLPPNCGHVIGLMGHLDAFIKRKILMNDERPYYLIVPENEIVNEAFFEYWKTYLHTKMPQIENVSILTMQMAYSADWNWSFPQSNQDTAAHVHASLAQVQRQWSAEGREPLLKLMVEHREVLKKFKRDIGLSEDDWFVCLHVRTSDFYNEQSGSAQDFRNTPIEDYELAIKVIVDAGGWVIRMGDATCPGLSLNADLMDVSRVYDYARSPWRSAALDVALSASCRLFVSSPSGLHTVAHAFGRPVCYVNYPIYAGFPWHPGEIFIPQLYYSVGMQRILSMEEILSSDIVHFDHGHLMVQQNIVLLRNTPDEIAETVKEALLGDAYSTPNMFQAKRARESFQYWNKKYSRDISGEVGSYFAQKYAEVIFSDINRVSSQHEKMKEYVK